MEEKNRVCIGAFAGAHGVKGAALIKTFTDAPENITTYGPVEAGDGARIFTLSLMRIIKPGLTIVTAPEIASREDAQTLKGTQLFINRNQLPPPDEDEFYHEDLIGLEAVDETSAPLGRVNAVYNFGAGDLLELEEIPGVKGVRIVLFTKALVPKIDIAAGRITVMRAAINIGEDIDD